MDVLEQFQRDFHEGRLDLPRLFNFLFDSLQQLQQTQAQLKDTQTQLQASQAQLQQTQQQLKTAENRIAELEKKLGGPPTPRVEQSYSMRAEEKRQHAKDGKKKNKSSPLNNPVGLTCPPPKKGSKPSLVKTNHHRVIEK